MAVSRFSNAGGFKTFQRYNTFLAGNPTAILDVGSMFPLGIFTLTSSQATVEFTNIPQTYSHLQLRCMMRTTDTGAWNNQGMQFNNDGTNSYAFHTLWGLGSGSPTASATASTSQFNDFMRAASNSLSAGIFGVAIVDLLDYRSTNKFKTMRVLAGGDSNGAGMVGMTSGLWMSTNAITSIKILPSGGNAVAGSTFALYGVSA